MTTVQQSPLGHGPADPPNGRMEQPQQGNGGRIAAVLAELREHLAADRATNIGFPSTFDFDYSALFPFFNNCLSVRCRGLRGVAAPRLA